MRFLIELDKLKTVLRQTLIADGSRQENTAEHSWHLATMALVLAEYAPQPLDLQRALAIALVHDLVEIHAGDSFCYDPNAMRTKEAREALAAARLFTLLPPEQASYLHQLWQEFEACNTNEARYITALDRLQPLLQNYASRGGSWKRHGITLARVIERSAPIADTCPLLWDFARKLIEDAAYQGLFPTSSGSA
ncbi:MAG: HD domain-containing protein [bacterium]|nr:HD domain-containing protein [bacterium]